MAPSDKPVAPLTIDDHIGNGTNGAPEITQAGKEKTSNEDSLKSEPFISDTTQPRQSKSWRTRLVGAGRAPTVSASEVHKNEAPPYEPIQDQETHFAAIDETQMRSLRRDFHPPSQLKKLLFRGFLEWLVTAALCGTLGGIMYHYTTISPMTRDDKRIYNFLVVGLSLTLGMNLAKSLKSMAMNLRWWVLSLRKRSLREVDIILDLGSLRSVCRLAFVAPRLAPACFSYILLFIMSQVGIALIGLCYSPDSQTDIALVSKGLVLVPDMSRVFTVQSSYTASSDTIEDQQYTANNFGRQALAFYPDDASALPERNKLWSAKSPIEFRGYDNNSIPIYWKYVFLDMNYEQYYLPALDPPRIFTNRTVNATWSCNSWLITEGGNGTSINLTIQLDSNGHSEKIAIPYAGGSNQTTFITNPTIDSGCGPGCSTVYALEASDLKPWWYQCNITISDTQNATLPEHQIGEPLQEMAAAAIALEGHVTNPTQQKTGQQYQYYPATSYYGLPRDGDTDSMGANIGEFAIGVVAAAADWNPWVPVDGDSPDTGSQLEVNWVYISIIFGLTSGLQLILFMLSSWVANLVIVKDVSAISTARLLRPIVDRLGPAGTYADGKQICKLLDDQGYEKFVYSVKHPQQGILHHLDIGHQKRLRAFPRGDYD